MRDQSNPKKEEQRLAASIFAISVQAQVQLNFIWYSCTFTMSECPYNYYHDSSTTNHHHHNHHHHHLSFQTVSVHFHAWQPVSASPATAGSQFSPFVQSKYLHQKSLPLPSNISSYCVLLAFTTTCNNHRAFKSPQSLSELFGIPIELYFLDQDICNLGLCGDLLRGTSHIFLEIPF